MIWFITNIKISTKLNKVSNFFLWQWKNSEVVCWLLIPEVKRNGFNGMIIGVFRVQLLIYRYCIDQPSDQLIRFSTRCRKSRPKSVLWSYICVNRRVILANFGHFWWSNKKRKRNTHKKLYVFYLLDGILTSADSVTACSVSFFYVLVAHK